MIKLHYNVESGEVINAYDVESCKDIPAPNIEVFEAEWTAAAGKIATVANGVLVLTDKPAPVVVYHYSKLLIIRALKNAELWAQIKAAIVDADAWDEWEASTYISSDDALYTSMSATLAASYPEIDLAALLANCLY